MVEERHLIREVYLAERVREPFLDLLLGFGAAAAQPALELLVGRRVNEDEPGADPKALLIDVLRALHVYVQDAYMALPAHGLDRLPRGAIHVPMNVRVLNELTLVDLFLHRLHVCKVVGDAVFLPRPWAPRGVRDGEAELVREDLQEPLDE